MNQAQTLLAKNDAILAHIIGAIPLPDTEGTGDVFFDLISCIVDQQIHYRSIGAALGKVLQLLQNEAPNPDDLLTLDEEAFSKLKISNIKYQTLLRLADYWKKHHLHRLDWTKLSDQEVRNLLGEIKGIGAWTIDMILLYTLNRPDIFPVDDYHLKQMMVKLYCLNPETRLKAQMLEVAEVWAPQRSLAVKYILAWKEELKNTLKK